MFVYRIESIDGISIEETATRKIWFVVFKGPPPTKTHAMKFTPAVSSVIEWQVSD